MCESIFIPDLAPVLVLLPPLPPPCLRVRDDAQIQWRICANQSQWGLGLNRGFSIHTVVFPALMSTVSKTSGHLGPK